jgi:hypothetical protein
MKQPIILYLALLMMGLLAPIHTHGQSGRVDVKPGDNLQMAVRQAREMRRLGVARQVTLHLSPGVYRLQRPLQLLPEDSALTLEGPNAVISGGVQVAHWQREGKLLVADAPVVAGRRVQPRQLWVNGSKATLASQFGPYKLERLLDFRPKDECIVIKTPSNLKQLQQGKQLEMLVHQRWAIVLLRVKNMEQRGDSTLVRFQEPESYLEFSHPWPQPVINGECGSSSYCLQNAFCLLDQPGEWFQDSESGKIYYYPKAEEKAETLDAEIPCLERLVTISGAPGLLAEGITVKGITFSCCGWTRPSRLGHVTLQGGFPLVDAYKLQKEGLPWCDRLENQAWIERPDAAVSVAWSRGVTFVDCDFVHLGATGLDFPVGDKCVVVRNCRFNDIGGTALMAGSFSEGAMEVHRPYLASADEGEYCDTLLFKGNAIEDATNEDWGAVGIGCGYVRNAVITQNKVTHVNYSGICVGWGWTPLNTGMRNNTISENVVGDYARMLYDAGGIYTLSSQPNSFIIDNQVSQPAQAPYATNRRAFKLYLDDSSDGFTIKGNHFEKNDIGTNHPGNSIHNYEAN